jgi:hypothetical protein
LTDGANYRQPGDILNKPKTETFGESLMLTIRREQMAAFEASGWQIYKEKLISRFRTTAPQWFENPGELEVRRLTERAIQNGIRYGFESKEHVARLAELMFEFPQNFEDEPRNRWIGELLGQTDIASQSRMAMLVYRMTGRTIEI